MMKKNNFLLLGALGLALASCSQEEVVMPGTVGDGNFTVTVNLPASYGSRAIGDGTASTYLNVAVYDATTGSFVLDGNAEFAPGQLTTTVSFNLANGKSYNIAFFAQSPQSMNTATPAQSVYYFDAQNGTVTVNYDKMTSAANLADAYDCFYKLYTTGPIGGTSQSNVSVVLTRPVAQINWGTSDLDDVVSHEQAFGANGQYMQSTLTAQAYNTLNLRTGAVSQVTNGVESTTPATVRIQNMAAPCSLADAPAFPLNPTTPVTTTYDYISVSYLLMPASEQLTDEMSLSINNGLNTSVTTITNDVAVTNAPVQANYRTNIYGALLTTNTVVNVTKDPTWGTPDNDVSITVWDGQTRTLPTYDSSTQTLTVNRASDLAGLADIVSGRSSIGVSKYLQGVTVTLAADFDMGGNSLMIGSATRLQSTALIPNSFRGVFDGGGHTISNLKVNGTSTAANCIGMFAYVEGTSAKIQNVNFDNLVIDAPNNEQAGVVGLLTGGATIENVNVMSGSVTAKEAAGGVVGRVTNTGTVSKCNNFATITASTANAGGIAGAAYYTGTSGITIQDCTNYGSINTTGTGGTVGGIVGLSGANVVGCVNNGAVGNLNCTTVGGIVAYQNSCGSIKDCINNGNVTAAGNAGGIIGWTGNISYTLKQPIYITGNTNNGTLLCAGGIGGIMGFNRSTVYLEDNINNAPSITANSGVAAGILQDGFIGGSSTATGGNGYVNYSNNTNTTPLDKISGTKVTESYFGTVMIDGETQTNN